MKENNAFEKSKWDNCGSGIQNKVWWPLWMWFQAHTCVTENLSLQNCNQTQGHHQPFSKQWLLAAATLWFQCLPHNYVTILNPNLCLMNKQTTFLPAPILIIDKQLTSFVGFAFYKPPPFCSLAEHNSRASQICLWAIVFSLAQTTFFFVLLIDCLLIILINITIVSPKSD